MKKEEKFKQTEEQKEKYEENLAILENLAKKHNLEIKGTLGENGNGWAQIYTENFEIVKYTTNKFSIRFVYLSLEKLEKLIELYKQI